MHWDSGQYLQADRKGRVFLFRSDTLSVYPLDGSGQLGEPTALQGASSDPNASPRIRFVALSPAGDDWLLSPFMGQPRWFPGGKEKQLPALPQHPSAVGFAGSTPIVAVLPLGQGQSATPPTLPGENPVLLELAGTQWAVRSREEYSEPEPGAFTRGVVSTWARVVGARRLASRGDGKLWVAHTHAYRLELQSPAGKRLAGVEVGPKHGTVRANTEAELAQIAEARRSQGFKAPASPGSGLRADPVIVGLAAGRDDRAYLLKKEGSRILLDRFDPLASKLQRLELTGLEGTNFTMAAGKDALYLAAIHGEGGRWRIAWEQLEAAEWHEVEDARIDGMSEVAPTPTKN